MTADHASPTTGEPSERDDPYSVDAARARAEQGELAQWVAEFLASDGSDNAALAEQLRTETAHWVGPVRLPFDQLHRLAGSDDDQTLGRMEDDDLERVEAMEESIDDGWEPPPLVVTLNGDQLVVEDGTHRVEGLQQAGEDSWWSVVGCADDDERDRFLEAWT